PTVESIGATLHKLGADPEALEHLLWEVTQGRMRQDCDDVTLVLLNASPGESGFNESVEALELTASPAAKQPEISYAETPQAMLLIVEGRVTWLYGQILFETAMAVINEKRDVVIDLSGCEHMDSTLLGTLHELTLRALEVGCSCVVQNVSPHLEANFEELSMTVVLEHMSAESIELPAQRTHLDLSATHLDRQQHRLLKAHEVLAELSDENQEQFGSLVETLRSESGSDTKEGSA
ncbi:MAG: STAS domain-containing protein, partial [Pseudomonadales bacterium]